MIRALLLVWLCMVPMAADARIIPRCEPHGALTRWLKKEHNETPRFRGVVSQQTIMEIFRSPGGSWSIVATVVSGRSCIVMWGTNWDDAPPAIEGEPL